MGNVFRLKSSTMFVRADEEIKESPLRVVFLSVEGNKTERQYFEYIEKYRDKLGIKAAVHLHTLQRAKKDTLSAPEDVLELLEEYLEIRNMSALPERLQKVIPSEYTDVFIKEYLNQEVASSDERVKKFEAILLEAGIDIVYNRYLKDLKGKDDLYGIVIDRDYKSHSVQQMNDIIKQCEKKGYKCYITTPLFEFWLLLHLVDAKNITGEELTRIRINENVSDKHTFTSKWVSDLAGHVKSISEKNFIQNYLPKVDFAINQARENFCTDLSDLVGDDLQPQNRMGIVGTNLPDLFDLLRADIV